jgi:acetolactate synthase-1/2/3 large subunit
MRVADWIMRRLVAEGVRHVFLLPGGGAMHLNDALALEKQITPVPCHHEQACAIAAEAYGRTGYPSNPGFGVALVTTGPGATNVVTAVAGAWLDSIPMLVISGQVKRADRVAGRAIRQGGVQEVEVIPMVRGFTKFAATVEEPAMIVEVVETALRIMREGRPGPVWIEVPLDVQGAPINATEPYPKSPATVSSSSLSISSIEQLDRVTEMLAVATRPLFLAGHGIRLAGAANPFRSLCERWQVPAVATWNAMDLLPYDHPLYVGRPGTVALRAPNFAVQNSDLLISIGCRLDNVVTAYNPLNFAPFAHKVMVDVDLAELERAKPFTAQQIQCDAGAAIRHWLEASPPTQSTRSEWIKRCADWKKRYPVNDGKPVSSPLGISHYELVEALSDEIPGNTLVATGSSGLAIEAFYSAFRNREGQRIFLTSGLGSMGYGLPTAIGACLGSGSKPMVAVEGDGSLMLNLQELATLATLRLPIRLVIIDNRGYASIRNTQRNYFDSRFIATGPDSGLEIPDLAAVASSFGLPTGRVSASTVLRHALREFLSADGPSVLVVDVLPDETLQPKVSALPQADGSILSMPIEDMSPLLLLDQLQAEMMCPASAASLAARNADRKN